MSNDRLYLTIDSKKLKSTTPEDITVYLKNELHQDYTKVWLKKIYVQYNIFVVERGQLHKCHYIHCSVLNKDDNLINGEKSDIIAILHSRAKSNRQVVFEMSNTGPKLIIPRSSTIRMYTTDADNNIIKMTPRHSIIYDLEFLK